MTHETPILMTTRYDKETWIQYKKWREKYNLTNSYYYSCPLPISETIPLGSQLFILEMHNTLNKIMGMGVITLQPQDSCYYKIYDNDTFNRYHYHSNLYISRDDLSKNTILLPNGIWISVLELLEVVCFKGKRHSKRHMNIARIPTVYFQGTIMNKVMDYLIKVVNKKKYENNN